MYLWSEGKHPRTERAAIPIFSGGALGFRGHWQLWTDGWDCGGWSLNAGFVGVGERVSGVRASPEVEVLVHVCADEVSR